MFVGDSIVSADPEISLLGIDYNTNLSTSPYLQNLATEAKSRVALIYRLSFGVPQNLLKLLANGLVIGKILAAAPAAIPFKLAYDDRAANLATENINRSIKSVARTITKTALNDKVSSKSVLEKAGLRPLNEMVASQTALMVGSQKRPMIPLEEIYSQSDPSGGTLGPSIAQMLLNLSLETATWLQTSWLGPGTHLLNSLL